MEIDSIAAQPESIGGTSGTLEKEIVAIGRTLPGYERIFSIMGIDLLSTAAFPHAV